MNNSLYSTDSKSNEESGRHLDYHQRLSIMAAYLCLMAIAVGFSAWYVGQENAFYWSDFNYYHLSAWFVKLRFVENPLLVPLLIFGSTKMTHNLIFTLPLLPFTLIFDVNRTAYITALMVAYVVPFAIMLGAIQARSMLKQYSLQALLAAPLIAIVTPAFMVPALRGYPDYAAALPLMAAAYFYLGDAGLRSLKKNALIGVLLGLCPLLRRHYFYACLAFAMAALVHQLLLARLDNPGKKWFVSNFLRERVLKGLLVIGFCSFSFLITFGFLFIQDILTHDYLHLYTSALVSFQEGLIYFVTAFGGIQWLLSIIGFVLAYKSRIVDRSKFFFITFFSALLVLVWPLLGKHEAVHYTIYADPFVILGTSYLWLFVVELIKSGSARMAVMAALGLFHLGNCLIGFAPVDLSDRFFLQSTRFGMLSRSIQEGDTLSRLFSANYPPQFRKDRNQVLALAEFLRNLAPNKEPIFMGAWSEVLSDDILKNAERARFGWNAQKLEVLEPPFLDSRDSYPLERLLSSRYLVLVRPLLTAYKPEAEGLLKIPLDCFSNARDHWALADDFVELPQVFELDNGYKASVYKRIRPTSLAVAAQSLERMIEMVQGPDGKLIRPGGQPPWIDSDEMSGNSGNQSKNVYKLMPDPQSSARDPKKLTHFLISADRLPPHLEVQGDIEQTGGRAEEFALYGLMLDADGKIVEEAILIAKSAAGSAHFSGKFTSPQTSHLALIVEAQSRSVNSKDAPQFVLTNLRLAAGQAHHR